MNKVILIGNIGTAPELKVLKDSQVTTFTMATSEQFKKKDGTESKETTWHTIKAWGKLAEIVQKLGYKGQHVAISGKLKIEEWEKDGIKRSKAVVVADAFEILSKKEDKKNDSPKDKPYSEDMF